MKVKAPITSRIEDAIGAWSLDGLAVADVKDRAIASTSSGCRDETAAYGNGFGCSEEGHETN